MMQKILGTPPMYPHQCATCLLVHHEEITYFMDTGINGELPTGVVYLCNRCFKEMVRISGDYQQTDDFNARLAELEEHYQNEIKELSLHREAVGYLTAATKVTLQDLLELGRIEAELAAKKTEFGETKAKLYDLKQELEKVEGQISQDRELSIYYAEQAQIKHDLFQQFLRPMEEVIQSGLVGENARSVNAIEPVIVSGPGPEPEVSASEPSNDRDSDGQPYSLSGIFL